jgi:TetR/AcrR family transcriptional regulator, cholesterol catabolism regulator
MPQTSSTSQGGSTNGRRGLSGRRPVSPTDSRFERQLNKILEHATDVFYERGYEGASMRDLSRATGMSLAGLYYYFESKEKLLYLIQKHTFTTIIEQLRERLEEQQDAEARVRIFILNHLEYFLANQKAMKVLSHEDDVLKNGFGAEIAAVKREYYKICRGLLEELKVQSRGGFDTRIAVLSLFGMMNWIYTWHHPKTDADAESLARQMGDIFLHGLTCGSNGRTKTSKSLGLKSRN